MSHNCANIISPDMSYPFDARGVAKRFRHAAIFGALRRHGRNQLRRPRTGPDRDRFLAQMNL